MSDAFTCTECGASFTVSASALAKYPGWKPRTCMKCRKPSGRAATSTKARRAPSQAAYSNGAGRGHTSIEQNLTLAEVLVSYDAGPKTGVFTDGSAQPNPGPGGWGVVFVVDDQVQDQRYGHESHTTNNRMELMALINAYQLVPAGTSTVVYSDSELCVKTMNEWAPAWQKRGWRRKSGPIKNLDLVQELYALFTQRPEVELRWIKAHDGSRWNEYADSLATAYSRSTL